MEQKEKRPAHRPTIYNGKAMSFKIDGDLIEKLNEQENKSRFINNAIRKALGL